jgi:hypothetical protein
MRRLLDGIRFAVIAVLMASVMGAQVRPSAVPTAADPSALEASQAVVAPQVVVTPKATVAAPDAPQARPPETLLCPGGFPTDLTVVNCRYTGQQRREQFMTTSVTDGAMLGSIFGALFSQGIGSPSEWPRTWQYYGDRLGASYTSSLGRGTAEYLVGALVRDDPRHIKCADDASPLFRRKRMENGEFACSGGQRFAHFLLDTVTVRKSTPGVRLLPGEPPEQQPGYKDLTRRHPAWARLAGVFAGAVAQYPWEPHAENTFGAISQRAGISFGQTFLGSFYKEYGIPFIKARKVKEEAF